MSRTEPKMTDAQRANLQAELDREGAAIEVREQNKGFNVVSVRKLSDIADVNYADMDAYLAEVGIDVTEASPEVVAELTGDGFTKIDKKQLINVPFIILTWSRDNGGRRIKKDDGSDGDGFLICRAVTAFNAKVWFVTGGYGLAEELEALTKARIANGSKTPNAGYKLPKGLHADELPDYPGKYIYRTAV